jgi:hypothetical protein
MGTYQHQGLVRAFHTQVDRAMTASYFDPVVARKKGTHMAHGYLVRSTTTGSLTWIMSI